MWFKRNQWPEHLKGCNLRHLSQATRLPDRDEELFVQAVEANAALIERCVKGLSTLDAETRRWLRSAKQNEPDLRPLGRLQNESSQVRHGNYFARLICYALRVLASEESTVELAEEGSEDEDSSSEDQDSSGGDESDEGGSAVELVLGHSTHASTDIMKDARRLFPWRGRQKQLLQAFRESLRNGAGEELQQDALLDFYRSIIF